MKDIPEDEKLTPAEEIETEEMLRELGFKGLLEHLSLPKPFAEQPYQHEEDIEDITKSMEISAILKSLPHELLEGLLERSREKILEDLELVISASEAGNDVSWVVTANVEGKLNKAAAGLAVITINPHLLDTKEKRKEFAQRFTAAMIPMIEWANKIHEGEGFNREIKEDGFGLDI
jgi:hypothetical protein